MDIDISKIANEMAISTSDVPLQSEVIVQVWRKLLPQITCHKLEVTNVHNHSRSEYMSDSIVLANRIKRTAE